MRNFIDAESRNIYLPHWIEPGMSDAFRFSLRSALCRRISSTRNGARTAFRVLEPPANLSCLVLCDAVCAMSVGATKDLVGQKLNCNVRLKVQTKNKGAGT
jgi:hypothetical protein